MVQTKLKMHSELKEAFTKIKPLCDTLMESPSLESIAAYCKGLSEQKREIIQELQQYILYPLISRLKCNVVRLRSEVYLEILNATKNILEKITLNSFEMFIKLETSLIKHIFDSTRPGMVSASTEEVKYGAVRALTLLILHIPHEYRVRALQKHVPMLAQAVFVCAQIAKLERLRTLRIASIHCVLAHTMTHPKLTVGYHIQDQELELLVVDSMLTSILPGVLAALQDVCVCPHNPTHIVVTAAVNAVHRILCIPMNDKYLQQKPLKTEDFVAMLKAKTANVDTDVSSPAQKSPKDMEKRSPEWFMMAGEKLTLITKSLISLRVYEHSFVRKELAIYCYRVLTECTTTMTGSIPLCLDVLISLSKDDYSDVAVYCASAVSKYFANTPEHARGKTLEYLCDNFMSLLASMPRVLNNIDENRKLSILNLLYGYISALMTDTPQRLTLALSSAANMQHLCTALCVAARHDTRVATLATRQHFDITSEPEVVSPWSRFQHLGSAACVRRLQEICVLLGAADCAELVLDVLLERFQAERECEPPYILNWMMASRGSSASMARRIIYAYTDYKTWYLPLEVGSAEAPPSQDETLDVSVYNPRAWTKDSVPGLYEGGVEVRYTDISYRSARAAPRRDPRHCATLAEAQRNLVLSCLLTEGVGLVACRLRDTFDSYLQKTLCPIMERVGSEYEMLHQAGARSLGQVAVACGHASVGELICANAGYFTHEVSVRLKKAWQCQSALKILSVVMEYSDCSIADSLYGIISDVLLQSCDKYHETELQLYLQAFLASLECIRKWYPPPAPPAPPAAAGAELDLLAEVREYVKDTQEAERLLSDSDFDTYATDADGTEHFADDGNAITETPQPPQHALVTIKIVKRCINFMVSPRREETLLALQILNLGLPILGPFEDELLPLVYRCWAPLVTTFHCKDPVVLRRALDLLVTLATLSKDFIHNRTVKEVLPEVYKYLGSAHAASHLKDAGSAYRASAAYRLQLAALRALPALCVQLALADHTLAAACACVHPYLSNKQPKPLQETAVQFFKTILEYEYAAAWYHLRAFCDNDAELPPPPPPPAATCLALHPVRGTPLRHKLREYDHNIQLIFDFMVD